MCAKMCEIGVFVTIYIPCFRQTNILRCHLALYACSIYYHSSLYIFIAGVPNTRVPKRNLEFLSLSIPEMLAITTRIGDGGVATIRYVVGERLQII